MNALGGEKTPNTELYMEEKPDKKERNKEESAASREEGIRSYKHLLQGEERKIL